MHQARSWLVGLITAGVVLTLAGTASAAIFLPTTAKDVRMLRDAQVAHATRTQAATDGIMLPAPGCPENGVLYPVPSGWPSGVPYLFSNCGVTELPATGAPVPGNMSYWGGPVQVHPKEYLIYWGWGSSGAWPKGTTCTSEPIGEGSVHITLPCDADSYGKYLADWVHQMGGTGWAKVNTQYYENGSKRHTDYIQNDKNWLAGAWVDNGNPSIGDNPAAMATSKSSNPAGPTNTYWLMAQEAVDAAAHFHVSGAALKDANFIIVQPPLYTDPNALASGYCAFHDYTDPNIPGNSYYKGLKLPNGKPAPYLAYTNAPDLLEINSSGLNLCGENFVNSGSAGKLDGFSVAIGHEISETATDPGAEDLDPATKIEYGGWYDPFDADEIGDKCAWVGLNPATDTGPPLPIPGATGDVKGNAGETFAVQSVWSNADDEGTGYCAGAGTDTGAPADAYGKGGAPDAPVDKAAPTITDTAKHSMIAVGDKLIASPGTWSKSPTTYVYQWEACDATGCSDIVGATSRSYTVKASEVGKRLAVVVYAADTYASSLTASSKHTPRVGRRSPVEHRHSPEPHPKKHVKK